MEANCVLDLVLRWDFSDVRSILNIVLEVG